MSFTLRVMIGLAAGLAIGIGIASLDADWLRGLPAWIEPIGLLFVNAIRMTVIPLVASGLIVGVASIGDGRAVGRLGVRSLALAVALVAAATGFAAVCAVPLLAGLHVDPGVAAGLRANATAAGAAAAEASRHLPTWSEWVVDLVPTNALEAAARGAILPLTVFSLAFGLALSAIEASRRQVVVGFFLGVSDAMLALVRWILRFTPVGVFALALPLGARMGAAAAGALLFYIVLLSAVSGAFIVLVLYPLAIGVGRVPLGAFVRAAGPAQAVAFSSRSSLAALPATIEGARDRLRWPEHLVTFYIPLAASMFRVGGAIAQTVAVLFVARLYGVVLSPSQLATVLTTVVVTSFTIPGIPAGAIITMAPVLSAAGVPAEGIGVLIGVDTIPDMFRTLANVTGWMAAGTVLARDSRAGTK